jgi:TPR repeat protein
MGEFSVGACHHNGYGVPKDDLEAIRWYQLAADKGLAEAQYEVGVAFEKGIGREVNLQTALHWYRAAADQGLPLAQVALGNSYERGRGTAKDFIQAWVWYALAGKNLNARGMEETERMTERLSAAQLSQARLSLIQTVKANPALVMRENPLEEDEEELEATEAADAKPAPATGV